MKISAIIAGVIGAISVCALDTNSIWPVIITLLCLAWVVFVACAKWDDMMRFWVSKGYWSYGDDYLEDPWEKADIYEYKKK